MAKKQLKALELLFAAFWQIFSYVFWRVWKSPKSNEDQDEDEDEDEVDYDELLKMVSVMHEYLSKQSDIRSSSATPLIIGSAIGGAIIFKGTSLIGHYMTSQDSLADIEKHIDDALSSLNACMYTLLTEQDFDLIAYYDLRDQLLKLRQKIKKLDADQGLKFLLA